jgi:hypothetical protein
MGKRSRDSIGPRSIWQKGGQETVCLGWHFSDAAALLDSFSKENPYLIYNSILMFFAVHHRPFCGDR